MNNNSVYSTIKLCHKRKFSSLFRGCCFSCFYLSLGLLIQFFYLFLLSGKFKKNVNFNKEYKAKQKLEKQRQKSCKTWAQRTFMSHVYLVIIITQWRSKRREIGAIFPSAKIFRCEKVLKGH